MALPPARRDGTAIVTGASSGIGEAVAHALARDGYGVTLVARDVDRLTKTAGELREYGVNAVVLAADLADRESRAALPDRIGELGLVTDILVNNAGYSTRGPIAECDPGAELAMIEVDALAVADLCARFVPGMVARGRGAVLNVGSTTAFQPVPGQAAYAAAKSFVFSYTRTLAAELAGTGVTATLLCPGPVDTGFAEAAGLDREEALRALPRPMWLSAEAVAEEGVKALGRGDVLSIPGRPNQAAAVVSTLATKRLITDLQAQDAVR
ncbi:SDR family NAD(P)-dependent oxidoreductase [Actinoplanes derwentensis]|uniref:Ketoreductase domain-containing protein n=1 Tax=Actinoplanes derwentensis TaxID=113562 RepID=A0A1H2DDA0_9ACTN|nr:SDR family oxidoreductase [Actinoplanes derwentensis]GID90147.1 short-chain dehydrogenase [Actinoplanes derwentensis]SDT80713.1 hypothetical protein SAMN04489716_9325 [Actinoplanes derwentensis]